MIEWLTWLEIAITVVAAIVCFFLGMIGRKPNDLSMGFTGVVALILIVQLAVTIASPIMGNEPSGNLFEFYLYLVTALLIPVGAGFWALLERSRWSTIVLGVANLAVAIMLYRMAAIWFTQGA